MKKKTCQRFILKSLVICVFLFTICSQYTPIIENNNLESKQSSNNKSIKASDNISLNWTKNLTVVTDIYLEDPESKVRITKDSDYIYVLISYYTYNFYSDNFYVLKVSKTGDLVFNKSFTPDYSVKITDIATSNSGLFLCGEMYDPEAHVYSAHLIKLNISSGEFEWSRNSTNIPFSTRMKIIGNYIYTAGMRYYDIPDVFIVKWDLNGNQMDSFNITASAYCNSTARIPFLEMYADLTEFYLSYYYEDNSGLEDIQIPLVLKFDTELNLKWMIQLNISSYNQTESHSITANSTHLLIYGRTRYNETDQPDYLVSIRKSDQQIQTSLDLGTCDFVFYNSFVQGTGFYQLLADRISKYKVSGAHDTDYSFDIYDFRSPKYMTIDNNGSVFCVFAYKDQVSSNRFHENFTISKLNLPFEEVNESAPTPNTNPNPDVEPNPSNNPSPNPTPNPSIPVFYLGFAIFGSVIGVVGGQFINPKNIKQIGNSIRKRKDKRVDDRNLEDSSATSSLDTQISHQFEQPLDSLSMESELNALQTGAEIGTATAEQQNMIAMLLKYWNMIPKELRDAIEKLASKYSKFVKQETFRRLIAFENISTEFLTANKLLDLQNLEVALEKLSNAETGALKEKFIPIAEEAAKTKFDVQKGKGGK